MANSAFDETYGMGEYEGPGIKGSAYYQDASAGAGLDNLFTGNLDYNRQLYSMHLQNAFNASEAQKQRDWETQMANSAYQRAFADLSKAGLNPYAVYGKGGASGAATPSGATATSGSGSAGGKAGQGWQKVLGVVTNLVTSAMSLAAGTNNATLRALSAIDVANINRGFSSSDNYWRKYR